MNEYEDGEQGNFYYFSEMEPFEFKDTIHGDAAKSSIVNVKFKLKTPVRDDVYHFLTNDTK